MRKQRIVGWVLLALVGAASAAEPTITPLPHAHAHNDYEHARPLLDALAHGFGSVEADVWLVDGQLLVAHDRAQARPGRTLQKLYLDPLRERVAQNSGRVYRDGPSLTLLIDAKSAATNTWLAVRAALAPYAGMLTRFERERTVTNAVTVIISGHRARDLMEAEPIRLAAYDGRLPDLDGTTSAHLIPLVSDHWTKWSSWTGQTGPLPEAERQRLRALVTKAHAQGRRLRFWGAPDTPAVWREFRAAGVDLLNADDLAGLRAFLDGPSPAPSTEPR